MGVNYLENLDFEWSVEPDANRLLVAIELRESNPLESLSILHQLADCGSNLAKYYLGDAYANARGVGRDIRLGLKWYQNASDHGSVEASHRLAFWLWHDGEYQAAVEKLKQMSDWGYSPAMFILGSIYYSDYSGHNINKNADLAVKFWEQAERKGHLIAKRRLSIFLRRKESGIFNNIRGCLKLISFLPKFLYLSVRFPTSDRLRGWTYGGGLACADTEKSN